MADPKGIACDCGSCNRRVLESRQLTGGVRRRCQCQDCGARFTTYEQRQGDDESPPLVPVDVGSSRLLELLCTLLDRRRFIPNCQILDVLMLARRGVEGHRLKTEQICEVIDCPDLQNTRNRLTALRRSRLLDYESGTHLRPGYLLRRVGPA
jgi:hypothetical protein